MVTNTSQKKLWKYDSGVTAIEYALIAALIAIVIVASLTLVGTDLGTMIDNFSKKFGEPSLLRADLFFDCL